mgnify:CR=1 FL=1
MTSCKQLIALFLILVLNISANENTTEEYKVEILIFKFNMIETNEIFTNEINLPNKNVINLVEPRLYLNKNALNNFTKDNSFFSNLLKNINPKKIKNNFFLKETQSIENPKNWFRQSSDIENLYRLYEYTREQILIDNKSGKAAGILVAISSLEDIREAWVEIRSIL